MERFYFITRFCRNQGEEPRSGNENSGFYTPCVSEASSKNVQTVDWFLALVKAVQQDCPPLLKHGEQLAVFALTCSLTFTQETLPM